MIEPELLHPGDTVAITAASGIVNGANLCAGVKTLQSLGLQTIVMESCYAAHGTYLAGDDALRVKNLHQVFANKHIKGIFMARGGYGAARLLPHLDFGMIAQNPKVFVGYSDVTALHTALNQQAGFVTFHGPMVASCLANPCEESLASLMGHIFHGREADFSGTQTLYPGHAKGMLTGGNLCVIASTIGTPYEINTRGRILFMEEIDEEPYRVDRLLLQLKLAGKLDDAAAFAFGDFSPCTLETLQTALNDHILPYKKPTIWGVKSGHIKPNLTLPLGRMAYW